MRTAIIGSGLTGLTAGYRLARAGHHIEVFEQNEFAGGLASAIRAGNENLDRFYHHIFVSDSDLISLSEELNIDGTINWYEPKNAIFLGNCLYPFTTPVDLIRFKPISIFSRIRMGMTVLNAKLIRDYRHLESVTARDWIIKHSGKDTYEKIFAPLLCSKFDTDADDISGTWIWNKFKLRGSSRGKNFFKEKLGYMDGGFITLVNALIGKISEYGGVIRLNARAERIEKAANGKWHVFTQKGIFEYDTILFTCAPQVLAEICRLPEDYERHLNALRYKSNLCLLLELSKSLSSYYWITVSQKDIPFVLMIEHTNLVGMKEYGSHIVYLSRYLDPENQLFNASDNEITGKFISGIKKVFPDFKEEYILRARLHRARFAQPVITLNYNNLMPGIKTPLEGLYLASMAQIHPEDRGLNYSVQLGEAAAKTILGG